MTLRVRNLQVDVGPASHDAAVAWWAAALGGTPRGTDEPEYTHLDGVRSSVGVHVQRLGEESSRFHLDLETDGDVDEEIAWLRSLGATDVGPLPGGEAGRILADPVGLPFCVTGAGQGQHLDADRAAAHLSAVVLDVPAEQVGAEAGFWSAVCDGQVMPPHADHPEFRAVRGLEGPAGRLDVLVQTLADGPARMHTDLHVPNRARLTTEVARLVDLGAVVVARRGWVVLRVPGGQLVCVVAEEEDQGTA